MSNAIEQRIHLVSQDWPLRVPAPPHRHAAPSGPWPWQDLNDSIPISESTQGSSIQSHNEPGPLHWADYPECLFPNWKADQVARSRMKAILAGSEKTVIYHVDVGGDGHFSDQGTHEVQDERQFERALAETKPPEHVRVRAFFVENLSLPVMQMLGTKYNIEPFFWTSSVNWIPSRYQENVVPMQGDHITITLKFPRVARLVNGTITGTLDGKIDTQLPLSLVSPGNPKRNCLLILDLIALHMVRTNAKSSTIISYHPTFEWKTTSAEKLCSRVYLAGQSVYWQNIFKKTNDPTFVLLATLWYALYAWDEALETLWEHISQLELHMINTSSTDVTQELHKIRAHLLQYASLLEDFKESICFVKDTPNPVMNSPAHRSEYSTSQDLMKKECQNLLTQINRLDMSRDLWDNRLTNVMDLVFSRVKIDDSKQMQKLTQATVHDSAAMRQISYLTMVFLPASFAAGVFGMNVKEINPRAFGSLAQYIVTAISLTALTIWVIIANQGNWNHPDGGLSIWKRLMWPVMLVQRIRNQMSARALQAETV